MKNLNSSSDILILNNKLEKYNLLNHDFYQAWNKGELKKEVLKIYAKEYYHHVAAFPRYISYIHAQCKNIKNRQILLANLIEEEQGENNHPELWMRFAEGLGVNRNEIVDYPEYKNSQDLVSGYFDIVKSGYEEGLGALYAYERQTPKVSTSKIKGLKDFYNINDDRTLEFFTVHEKADEWHSQECADLISQLEDNNLQNRVQVGAEKGAKLLWGFLDQMLEVNNIN